MSFFDPIYWGSNQKTFWSYRKRIWLKKWLLYWDCIRGQLFQFWKQFLNLFHWGSTRRVLLNALTDADCHYSSLSLIYFFYLARSSIFPMMLQNVSSSQIHCTTSVHIWDNLPLFLLPSTFPVITNTNLQSEKWNVTQFLPYLWHIKGLDPTFMPWFEFSSLKHLWRKFNLKIMAYLFWNLNE